MTERYRWKEAHGTAEYIPCGNAYCTEGNCANCDVQMQLQVGRKIGQGIPEEELTVPEQKYLSGNESEEKRDGCL